MPEVPPDFEKIFKTQFPVLCDVAFKIIKNKKAAEDIVQDVFLKLWQSKHKLGVMGNHNGYLYRCTINASIDFLKNNKRVIPFDNSCQNLCDTSNGEKRMLEKELETCIEKAMSGLPPKCRAIFVLSRHEGMKYREIAGHLQISVKTVENQMGIALSRLREELRPYLTREFMQSLPPGVAPASNI
ncbi:MAG: RNA polymerase sigma-70 factor [Bacteroidia bacterium]